MKTFSCVCGQLIFFENVSCVVCGRELGFLPDRLCLSAIEPAENGLYAALCPSAANALYKKCANIAAGGVCNWMIPQSESNETFCRSCRLNEVIPDLSVERNGELWMLMERAKRRLVYTLISLQLPLAGKAEDPARGLAFRFLADTADAAGGVEKIVTGHEDGVITLNIAEADDGFREKTRLAMNEPYRTLLGHFRHEIGHYYWDRLIRDTPLLDPWRALFGDERRDYAEALKEYYGRGAPADWPTRFISAYASSHPWEDWAETWAHLLHIQDTLEAAGNFGLDENTPLAASSELSGDAAAQPVSNAGAAAPAQAAEAEAFDSMIAAWSKLAIALNSINRAMGHQDLYPFVLSTPVLEKLRFIYQVISTPAASIAHSAGAAS